MLKGLALTPPVIGRISIGRVVEKNGKRLPEKDDEFTITSQVQLKDGWVLHPVDEVLRKDTNAKLRSIPVRLLFGDPDLSLRVKYTLFERTTGRPLCVGDGESCRRVKPSSRLAFQNLHIRGSRYLPVEVRKHPGMLRMLQHRIDPAYLVARAPGVVGSHDGLQQCSPVHRALVIVGIDHWESAIAPGLLHPQLQLGLVGMKTDSSGSVRAADAAFAHLQPLPPIERSSLDQLEGRSPLGGRG